MLTVSTRDFGPIVEGTVDLKPLTIFMGRSNTGKSFMATAIYASMTALYDGEPTLFPRSLEIAKRHYWTFRRSFTLRAQRDRPEAFSSAMRAFQEWTKEQGADKLASVQYLVSDLPIEVREELELAFRRSLSSIGGNVIQKLIQTYGEVSGFVRRGSEPRDPQLTIKQDNPKLHLNVHLSEESKSTHEFDISQVAVPTSIVEDFPIDADLDEDNEFMLFLNVLGQLESSVIEQALIGLPQESFYLPAARSGIAQGHKVLAASLVRQSSRIGLEPVNIPTLPGIATEFLSHIIGLDRRSRTRPKTR